MRQLPENNMPQGKPFRFNPFAMGRQRFTSPGRLIRDKMVIKKAKVKTTVVKNEGKKISDNRAKFLTMIKTRFPKVYKAALHRISKSGKRTEMAGLGAESSWWETISTAIKEVIPSVMQAKQQRDLMKMQLTRAQAGLPPANVRDYAPVIRTEVELGPVTRAGFIEQLGQPVIIGGLALAAWMMFGKKRR